MKKSLFLLIFLLPTLVLAIDTPTLSSPVTDLGDMLSPVAEEQLKQLISAIEQETTAELVVLTVPSLDGMSKEDFAAVVFEKNKFGKKDKDNGLLLLISRDDRVYRVEVGYGLEPYITDAKKVEVGVRIIEANFKQGMFDQGVYDAVAAMGLLIQGEEDVISQFGSAAVSPAKGKLYTLISMVIVFLFIISLFGRFGIFFFPIPIGGRNGGFAGGGFGSGGSFGGGFGGGSFGGGGFGGSW